MRRVQRLVAVADAVDELAVFGQGKLLGEVAAAARFVERVSVYLGLDDRPAEASIQVIRDFLFRVEPWAFADPVSRVDRRLTGTRLRAEIGAPRLAGDPGAGCQHPAMRIGARQPAKISTVSDRLTGHEERHQARRDAVRGWHWPSALPVRNRRDRDDAGADRYPQQYLLHVSSQLVAKQYKLPTPWVRFSAVWLQPLVPCDEFHEPLLPPLRSGNPIHAF